VLLAGLSLVGAAEDAISGFPVTAAARAFEVVTLTAGIVVGIAGVLDLAQRAQLPLTVADPATSNVPFAVALAAAAGMAGSWALAAYAPLARRGRRHRGRRAGVDDLLGRRCAWCGAGGGERDGGRRRRGSAGRR
jgi:threonine/serine exporter ThrE